MAEERVIEIYRFADLTLDVARHRVTRGDDEIALPGLSFDLLLALVRHAPRLLSTDELMTLVWTGRVVNAETVVKRVEFVRQALGDDVAAPRYIAAVRGRGYRLLPDVTTAPLSRPEPLVPELAPTTPFATTPDAPVDSPPSMRRRTIGVVLSMFTIAAVAIAGLAIWRASLEPAEQSLPAVEASAHTPSIAVLPFLNLSDDPANVWFSDGISEELLGALAKLPNLRVTSRTSAFSFRDSQLPLKDIARTLNVDHILEGSVRKAGERIRVTAQLIDVRTDSHLWAENYDRRLEDVFAIQQEIADHIVDALQVRLAERVASRAAPTTNVEAYQLYLQGVQVWNLRGEPNIRQAIRLLTHATELDPNFARAYAALAIAYASGPFWFHEPEGDLLARAQRAAQRAADLDSTLAHPHCVFAVVAAVDRDWYAAERHYRHALELDPNDTIAQFWLSEMYSVAGRTAPALELILASVERDPISMAILHDVANLYLRDHQFEQACPYVERGMRVGTNLHTYLQAAQCHEYRGDMNALRQALIDADRVFGYERPIHQLAHRARTNPAERQAALDAIAFEAGRNRWVPTETYRAVRDYDTMFDVMETAWRRGNYGPLRTLWDIEARELRSHPRFRQLVEEIGLVEFWRKSGWPEVCRPDGDSFACD